MNSKSFDPSVDGITLVQRYIASPEQLITRVEFVGREFVYAVRVDTSNGFELCPADVCALDSSTCMADAGQRFAFDIDDILNPEAEEEEDSRGFTTTTQRSSSPPKERRSMSGRQSASSEDHQDEAVERGPPKRRSVRKTKSRSDDQETPKKSPPVRKAPKRTSVNDDDDFSDFSF